MKREKRHTDRPDKDIKGPILDIRRASKIDQFDLILSVKNNILILDIAMHDESLGMQMVQSGDHLQKDIPTLGFLHRGAHLDVVKEVHAGQPVWYHLDVVVEVIFEEIDHFDNVRMFEPIAPDVVEDVDFERNGAKAAVCGCGVSNIA